jgi:hypothetical protein
MREETARPRKPDPRGLQIFQNPAGPQSGKPGQVHTTTYIQWFANPSKHLVMVTS